MGGMRPLDLSASACIDTESIDRWAPSSSCAATPSGQRCSSPAVIGGRQEAAALVS